MTGHLIAKPRDSLASLAGAHHCASSVLIAGLVNLYQIAEPAPHMACAISDASSRDHAVRMRYLPKSAEGGRTMSQGRFKPHDCLTGSLGECEDPHNQTCDAQAHCLGK